MPDKYSTPPRRARTERGKPVRAPFAYYGAKQRLAARIVGMLPPHNAWVEAFCGSAALTFAKPPAPIEVINDRDHQVVNLFRQLRNNSDALCRLVALTPYASDELEASRTAEKGITPLEQARRFLIRTMMTVNGTVDGTGNCSGFSFSQSFARGSKEARVNRWYNLPDRIQQVVERLRHVRVENRDARDLLRMFSNRPAALIYLDPPYFTKREHGYVIDANDLSFHEELLHICLKARPMILLSGYDNKLYESILVKKGKWVKKKIKTHTRDTTGRDYSRTEVLWMNAQFVKASKSRRVPIRLTKTEKAENKINPSRKR